MSIVGARAGAIRFLGTLGDHSLTRGYHGFLFAV